MIFALIHAIELANIADTALVDRSPRLAVAQQVQHNMMRLTTPAKPPTVIAPGRPKPKTLADYAHEYGQPS